MTNEDVRLRGHSHRPSLPCTTPVGPPWTRCNPESSDTEMSGLLEEKRKSEIGGKVDSEIGLREVAARLGIQGGMGPICKAINLIEFPWKLSEPGEIHSRAIKKYFSQTRPWTGSIDAKQK